MRKTLLLLGFVLIALFGQAQYKAYTIQATVSLTADSLLIVNGDTIGHFHSLGTDTIVDKRYVDELFTGTYVEFGDSVITFVTPAQLSDSLNSLPGGHDPVTLAASATNGGLSLVGQQIGFQAASTSLAGYLTSGNFNLFNNKLGYVSHDETLSGNGTTGSPLSADTSVVALRTWVESQNYVTSVYLSYDSLSDTPTIPEISNLAYGPGWNDNLDGASKNAIYDAIQSVGGGGATNLTYSATPDSGVVNSDTGTDATIPAGSTVNASLMLPEDKIYLDVVDDSLANHRTAINTNISDISDLSDSIDVFRPLIDANTGKDTTGIYHANRDLLDGISASDLDSNFVSLRTDTLFLGGDTIINFDLDTTNISGLQTFVENHSTGGAMVYPSAGIPLSTGSAWGTSMASSRFVYGDDETANIHYTGDLNSIAKSGFYYASGSSTNRPSGESDGYLITNQWANNANYQVQYFTPYDATKFYLRRKLYTGSWGSWVEVTGGSGSTTFLGLTDTPSSYTAGKWLKVNSGGTALEFTDAPSGSSLWTASGSNIYYNSGEVMIGSNTDYGSYDLQVDGTGLFVTGLYVNGTFAVQSGATFHSGISLDEAEGAPSTPSSGYGKLYVVNDGKIYFKNDSGTEYDLTDNGSSGWSYSVQTLSTTTPTWNVNSGLNATITLSGNTDITFSNLSAGMTGNLTVTNAASAYTLEFSGYTFRIAPSLKSSNGVITMSGSSLVDELSWYYDGTYVIINGTLGYD